LRTYATNLLGSPLCNYTTGEPLSPSCAASLNRTTSRRACACVGTLCCAYVDAPASLSACQWLSLCATALVRAPQCATAPQCSRVPSTVSTVLWIRRQARRPLCLLDKALAVRHHQVHSSGANRAHSLVGRPLRAVVVVATVSSAKAPVQSQQ
jgi:hypothetical protein